MAASIYITLAAATLLAVGASTISRLPDASTTSYPDLTIDNDNSTDDNDTYSGFGFTRYIYLDFPKIGYNIFKRKMLEAFKLFDHFMNMKPALLRISKYILHSDTKNDSFCLICSEVSNSDVQNVDDSVETNTESPEETVPLTQSNKVIGETEPVFVKEKDEVTQTEKEPEGFFSAVGGFFHKLTSWIG